MSTYGVRKKRSLEKDELDKMEKEELLNTVFRLQAHNLQLQNIISKQKLPLTDEDKLVIGNREDSTDDDNDGVVETPKCNIKKTKIKKKFDFSKCHKRHIFLKFLYLGWDYQGLVVQEDSSNTIEENLFNALTKACLIEDRQSCNYQRCGRTDKGVSGASQVISLDVRSNISVDKDAVPLEDIENDKNELPYCKMLNKLLPHDIRVISWCPVPETYNARYNCTSRSYKYYFIKGQLNVKAMSEATGYLVGEHDFRNLCKMDVGNGVVNFCRNMLEASIEKVSSDSLNDDNYDVYVLKIMSDGFLWHQIRCIVSVLLTIGQNKEEPSIIKHLLDIEKCPRRPQYTFAHHTPLIFHDCEFDFKPQWRYDSDNSKSLLLQLQKKWTISQIKSTQLRHIIDDVENMTEIRMPDVQTSGLLTEPVNHKPFIERQTCESLESRIEHFVKKQRIQKIEEKE